MTTRRWTAPAKTWVSLAGGARWRATAETAINLCGHTLLTSPAASPTSADSSVTTPGEAGPSDGEKDGSVHMHKHSRTQPGLNNLKAGLRVCFLSFRLTVYPVIKYLLSASCVTEGPVSVVQVSGTPLHTAQGSWPSWCGSTGGLATQGNPTWSCDPHSWLLPHLQVTHTQATLVPPP